MFILALRYRHGIAEQFPYDAYPVDAAWPMPSKTPKLVRTWRPAGRGRLMCSWHLVGAKKPDGSF